MFYNKFSFINRKGGKIYYFIIKLVLYNRKIGKFYYFIIKFCRFIIKLVKLIEKLERCIGLCNRIGGKLYCFIIK